MPNICSLNQAPIGIFDSGIGGLTITENIEQLLPNEQLIYIADQQCAPYGDKTIQVIEARVNALADYFISQHVKAIVIACNTATVNAIDQLRRRVNMPIIGVEPAIKPAALASKNKKVGVLVTQATSNNPRFLSLVAAHKNGSDVFIQPCPGLVTAIEAGDIHSENITALLQLYLAPLMAKNIDMLVLGCTHYPVLAPQIKNIVGEHITLLDTAFPVAKQLINQLTTHQLLSEKKHGVNRWLTTKAGIHDDNVFHKPWQFIDIP